MSKAKSAIYLLIMVFIIDLASAATIHGTIYDLSLKKLSDVKVEIDTSPKQVIIAKNGSYSFNVPSGAYAIKAQIMQKGAVFAFVQENITIRQQGDYVLDLILFPDIEEGVEDIGIDVNGEVAEAYNKNNISTIIAIAAALLLIAAFFGIYLIKKNKNQATEKEHHAEQKEGNAKETVETASHDLAQIIKIIEQEGGRATQKDIRKHIPLSEAKISLMIAELEHKGLVDKIKKGRGNIIILKKRWEKSH